MTQMVKVREVSLPSLPSIEHDSIDLWEMDGNIFNSVSFGNRSINLRMLIQPLDPKELEVLTQDVKRVFYTREPKALYLGDENKYMLCVPDGDVMITELGTGTNEIEVDLIAYYPYWISNEVYIHNFEGKEIVVENNGDVAATPVMSLGITEDTHFIQIDNQTTGERIFLGDKPTVDKGTSIKANTNILFDECGSTSGWVQSSAALETGCGTGGTIGTTRDGSGIMCRNFGSSNSTWKGASYRKNFSVGITDFKVWVDMMFTSDGTDGDPTVKQYMSDCVTGDNGGNKVEQGPTVSGVETTGYYAYHPEGQLISLRNAPSTSATQIGQYSPGYLLPGGTVESNGWLKIDLNWYKNEIAYVQPGHFEYKVKSNTVTEIVDKTQTPTWSTTLGNFVANSTAKLRSAPRENSSVICTIKTGTVVRCSMTPVESTAPGESKKYWQVYCAPGDKTGYIEEHSLTRANDVDIVYGKSTIASDDKTGKCQVYGFSSSGVQLFSLSLIDDNLYYEATYPLIKKNGEEFLKDITFNVPKPKQEQETSGDTIKYTDVASGKYGKWTGFTGTLYIERIKDVWYASVCGQRKRLTSPKRLDRTNSELPLSYIVIYFGTSDAKKPCDMAITRIKIQSANDIKFETQNVQHFEKGDVVEIDCGVPCVKVNGEEKPSLVDIGSQFFDLQKGQNNIKISSDKEVTTSVAYNERYL